MQGVRSCNKECPKLSDFGHFFVMEGFTGISGVPSRIMASPTAYAGEDALIVSSPPVYSVGDALIKDCLPRISFVLSCANQKLLHATCHDASLFGCNTMW